MLDLGFFNSLQSLQQKKATAKIDSLAEAVQFAFNEFPGQTILKTFITLKEVMKLVLLNEGGNYYKIPHTKKDAGEKKGSKIEHVYCGEHIFNKRSAFLERRDLR